MVIPIFEGVSTLRKPSIRCAVKTVYCSHLLRVRMLRIIICLHHGETYGNILKRILIRVHKDGHNELRFTSDWWMKDHMT
jgi:hypothetical protein